MLVKCTRFIPTLAFVMCLYLYFPVKIGQSRDKTLYILLAIVFYPVTRMMVAGLPLDRLGNAGECMISTLLPYFLWQWSIPTPFINS